MSNFWYTCGFYQYVSRYNFSQQFIKNGILLPIDLYEKFTPPLIYKHIRYYNSLGLVYIQFPKWIKKYLYENPPDISKNNQCDICNWIQGYDDAMIFSDV